MKYFDQVDWRGHKFSGGGLLSGQKTITNPIDWIDQHVYATDSECAPPGGFKFIAIQGGTSGNSIAEPTWPEAIDATVGDNDMVWQCASMAAQMQSVSTECSKVVIKALPTNAGRVYIGGSDMETTTQGFLLVASETTPLLEIDNLNKLYVIAVTSTDKVAYIASD